jgi:hypothetical protein
MKCIERLSQGRAKKKDNVRNNIKLSQTEYLKKSIAQFIIKNS